MTAPAGIVSPVGATGLHPHRLAESSERVGADEPAARTAHRLSEPDPLPPLQASSPAGPNIHPVASAASKPHTSAETYLALAARGSATAPPHHPDRRADPTLPCHVYEDLRFVKRRVRSHSSIRAWRGGVCGRPRAHLGCVRGVMGPAARSTCEPLGPCGTRARRSLTRVRVRRLSIGRGPSCGATPPWPAPSSGGAARGPSGWPPPPRSRWSACRGRPSTPRAPAIWARSVAGDGPPRSARS